MSNSVSLRLQFYLTVFGTNYRGFLSTSWLVNVFNVFNVFDQLKILL